MKIQHKRSAALDGGAAKEPTAAQTEFGELCVNFNSNDPALFIKDNADNIVRVGGDLSLYQKIDEVPNAVFVCPPSEIDTVSPLAKREEGALWWNTEEGILYVWYEDPDSSQWVISVPQGGSSGEIPPGTTVGITPPDPAVSGQLWWNSDQVENGGGRLYVYYENAWIDTSVPGGKGSYISEAEAKGLFLSKTEDDTAAGQITFTERSVHNDGIRSNGQTVSIKSEGFPAITGNFSRFAAFEGNMREDATTVIGQGLHFYNYRVSDGLTNQQTDVFITDGQSNSETFSANTSRGYIRLSSVGSSDAKNVGFVAFGGFGQAQSATRNTLKVYNTSDGLEQAKNSITSVADLTFPANDNGSARRTLSFVSRRVADGNTNNQQATCIEATRGAIRFDNSSGQSLGFYWSDSGTWKSAGTLTGGSWSGLSFRSVSIELDGDQETAFTTSYSTNEDGEQVAEQIYNGETQTLQSIIRELKAKNEELEARLAALEGA